jgi:hypothetical protein
MESPSIKEHRPGKRPILYLAMSKDGGAIFDPERDLLFKLTPIAAEMWKLLAEGKSDSETASEIARWYEIDEERVRTDFAALLHEATHMGLLPASIILSSARELRALPTEDPPTQVHATATPLLMVVSAFLGLTLFDLVLSCFSMKTMCRTVKSWRVRKSSREQIEIISEVCNAVQKACVWFPHKAVCLQRSAVTSCMLRSYGIDAKMVVGVRPMPFLAHAWTEVNDAVVNDRPQVKTFYQTLTIY